MKNTPAYRGKTHRRVRCQSGIFGWRCRLRTNYLNFYDFKVWNRHYNLSRKLGYSTAIGAWRANPVIEGSVNVSDFRKVFR